MECLKLRTNLHPCAATNGGSNIRRRRTSLRGLALAGAVAMLLSGCRLDMHLQPKYLPYEPSSFFPDGRSERQPVEGTVARGQLRNDELFYTGKINGAEANQFPFPITRADLERGRERFNIYCTPCHDYTGSGNGMIVQRGFPQPPSYHTQRLRDAPVGHFYGVITDGFGAMYSYAARIEPADRWRIAAYIRVLQLSQNANIQAVPAADRDKLGPQNTGQQNAAQTAATAVRP
jgi:cytochrome c553